MSRHYLDGDGTGVAVVLPSRIDAVTRSSDGSWGFSLTRHSSLASSPILPNTSFLRVRDRQSALQSAAFFGFAQQRRQLGKSKSLEWGNSPGFAGVYLRTQRAFLVFYLGVPCMPFVPRIEKRLHEFAVQNPGSAARAAYLGIIHDEIYRHSRRLASLLTEALQETATPLELQERRAQLTWAGSWLTRCRLEVPRRLKTQSVEEEFFGKRGRFVRAYTRGGWRGIQRIIRLASLEVICVWIPSEELKAIIGPETTSKRRLRDAI